MCGLVTIARPGGLREDERGRALHAMRDTLAHRGPDDATAAVVDGWVGLGHRRLSIIDLAGSRQPIENETGTVVCVFNGEIYNFRELRAELRARGHVFHTQGDGEVIVHGYEEWGDEVAARLEGMFAFALVDRERGRLVAARDRFGIKPLFWTRAGGAVLLGSELKALLAHPDVRRVASAPGLALGAVRMHVPWPLTAFDGIYRLPPGALLLFDCAGRLAIRRHAAMVEPVEPAPADGGGGGDVVGRGLEALSRAVERQMVADVPVGAFLSGGIDSTLLVALMTRLTREKIHTFSIRTKRGDESQVAAATARRLGTEHHEVDLEEMPFEGLQVLPELYDEPFAEASALGVLALSRAARAHIKVALSGDGGDEIFGGYDSYRWVSLASRATARVPAWLARPVQRRADGLLGRRSWPGAVRRGLRALATSTADPMTAHRGLATLAWVADPAQARASARLSARVDGAAARALGQLGPARLAMASDRLERLPDAMLSKVDRASMAASIEVRVPMLDDALVRFAAGLSERELIGARRGKLLLRRVLDRLLPGGPSWDKKRGFALPLDQWMRHPKAAARLGALLRDHQARLLRLCGLDPVLLWERFAAGRAYASQEAAARQLLWLTTVALWAERFHVEDAADADLEAVQLV